MTIVPNHFLLAGLLLPLTTNIINIISVININNNVTDRSHFGCLQ